MAISTGYIMSTQNNFLLLHHLLRDSTGTLWLFYLTPEGEINYGTSEDAGESWSAPALLTDEVTGPFSVAIDQNDGLHLCAIRKLNQLTYLQRQDVQWSINTLPLDTNSGQPFFPIVHVNEPGIVNIVCGFRKNNQAWSVEHYLIHPREYQFARTRFDVPFASDLHLEVNTGKGPAQRYVSFLCGSVDSDAAGNLHLIHRYFDGRYFQLYYNCYNFEESQWERPLPLVNGKGNCGIPAIAVDLDNKAHLLWVSAQENKFRLNYRQNTDDWQPPSKLPESSDVKTAPVLLPIADELAVCWQESGEIFYLPVDGNGYGVSIWTCPEDARHVKIHPQVWRADAQRVLPLTYAYKENEHYLLYFAAAFLPEDISIADGNQSLAPDVEPIPPRSIIDITNPDNEWETDLAPDPDDTLTETLEVNQQEQASEEPEDVAAEIIDPSQLTDQQDDLEKTEPKYDLSEKITKAEVTAVTINSKLITWKI
ncbi:MAG: hypothetical protein A4E53_02628 [Pelotomaculum sp. PtaB.Bin104]|nr:MAG: hypothetical protein A4E53_02628 [Pelotomaculum sp. PtaB.Bin104]